MKKKTVPMVANITRVNAAIRRNCRLRISVPPGKLVACAVDRGYVSRATGICLEFAPQVEDMYIYCTVIAFKIVTQPSLDQLPSAECPPRFPGKDAQELKFHWREAEWSAGNGSLMFHKVKNKLAGLDLRRAARQALGGKASEHGPDPGCQLFRAERLGDIIVRPDIQPCEFVIQGQDSAQTPS